MATSAMNLKTLLLRKPDTATHQSNEWITGKIAGIFEWDSLLPSTLCLMMPI